MPPAEVENNLLLSKIRMIRRLRTLWLVCWVPADFCMTLLFNSLTNSMPPYYLVVVLLFSWVGGGYLVSFFVYRRAVRPIYGNLSLRDAIALEPPHKANSGESAP